MASKIDRLMVWHFLAWFIINVRVDNVKGAYVFDLLRPRAGDTLERQQSTLDDQIVTLS